TLNAISGLVRAGRKDEATATIAGLADLLRYSLDHAGRQRVTLGEEIEMLTRYLEIQQMRFQDRMAFTITMDDTLRQAAVPILVLQPLVENAVRHGIARSSSAGRVDVHAGCDGGRLQLQVRNTGVMATPVVEGIGLGNTRERLRALYGDDASFSLAASGSQVVASINLPLERLQ